MRLKSLEHDVIHHHQHPQTSHHHPPTRPRTHQAFFSWFAIPPLLPMIRESLGLTSRQVHWSHLAAIGSSLVARYVYT